jgi:hypothetical protein
MMTEDVFEDILHSVKLPVGVLLGDRSTYRVTSCDFHDIHTRHARELSFFDKFLVLTNGKGVVVGGVLFYGNTDMQATIFPEYRGKHFMSAIHKNGILKSECYPDQHVSIAKYEIKSFDDFLMKHYLASLIGLKIKNLAEIHRYMNMFMPCDKYRGFQELTEEDFIRKYS